MASQNDSRGLLFIYLLADRPRGTNPCHKLSNQTTMPLHFVCPHCGAETLVPENYLGKSGACATCGREISIAPSQTAAPRTKKSGTGLSDSSAMTISIALVVLSLVFLIVVGVSLAWIFMPLGGLARGTNERACENNLKAIALAMQQYEQLHGKLPPAYSCDANGKPLHSWRVLILPQLGEDNLYRQFHFDEPWNSQANLAVAQSMPSVFHCEAIANTGGLAPTQTPYQVVVGSATLFPGQASRKSNDATDGISTTITVVESADNLVFWTEPRDIHFDTMNFRLNSGSSSIGSRHPSGAHVVFANGDVLFMRNSLEPALMRALLTARGGEAIDSLRIGNP